MGTAGWIGVIVAVLSVGLAWKAGTDLRDRGAPPAVGIGVTLLCLVLPPIGAMAWAVAAARRPRPSPDADADAG